MAAARWMGRGDKEGADGGAVNAMRRVLDTVNMDGIVVIGEGEKDEAPMLFNGERCGNGNDPATDIAVDPIDGTTLTALGRANAISVIAVSDKGTMFDPGPCVYMEKIAVGAGLPKNIVDLDNSVEKNIKLLCEAKNTTPDKITACVLKRPRHDKIVDSLNNLGVKINFDTFEKYQF